MLFRVNQKNLSFASLAPVISCLKDGGVIIYPTDTVYALGCDLTNARAIERICRIRNIRPERSNFSFVCANLSQLSEFTKPISNQVFRVMRKALPGPYTFILEANNQVPKLLKQNRKTVGIRVPDHPVCREIVLQLGQPLISSSLHDEEDHIVEYFTDPELIDAQMGSQVDMVVDGGFGNIYPSTVIDCSGEEMVVVREGLGTLDVLG